MTLYTKEELITMFKNKNQAVDYYKANPYLADSLNEYLDSVSMSAGSIDDEVDLSNPEATAEYFMRDCFITATPNEMVELFATYAQRFKAYGLTQARFVKVCNIFLNTNGVVNGRRA